MTEQDMRDHFEQELRAAADRERSYIHFDTRSDGTYKEISIRLAFAAFIAGAALGADANPTLKSKPEAPEEAPASHVLTEAQQTLFSAIKREYPAGLLHSMMTEEERRTAAELIKLNLVSKEHADINRSPVAYFCAASE